MSNQPTELNSGPSEEAKQGLRVVALQHASFLSSSETPLEDFLDKAIAIQEFLETGEVPPGLKKKGLSS